MGVGLFGAVISFAWSWHPSLWTDEAATITAARRSPAALWRMLHSIDAVHGLYYALAHIWVSLFGSSALALRLPSAIAVGLTASGLMVLLRRLGAAPKLTLIGVIAFCLLPRTTWMGLEGRSYAWTAAVAVLLTIILLNAIESSRWQPWIWYAVVAAFAIVLNIYGALLLVAHAVSLLLVRVDRRTQLRFAGSAVAGVLLASPVVLKAAGQSGQLGAQSLGPVRLVRSILINQAFLGETPTASNAPSASLSFSGHASGLWQPAAVVLAAVTVLVILIGVISTVRSMSDDDPSPAVRLIAWSLPWALLPAVLVGGYAMLGSPLYNPRYFSFTAPAIGILIAVGLEALGRRWLQVAAVAALLVLAAPVYVSQRQLTAKAGTDWVSVAHFVGRNQQPGQAVYFAPRYPDVPGDTVGRTLRSIEIAYPDDFHGLRDVTEIATPAQAGNLTGTSTRLAAAGPRLTGASAVWVIRRNDYPAELTATETQFLQAAGFAPGLTWHGPLTTVQEFRHG